MADEGSKAPSSLDDAKRCAIHDWKCMTKVDAVHQEYRLEINRLKSFVKSRLETTWPHERPDISEMARAGFFFTGFSDWVRCFECSVLIGAWHVPYKSPMDIHQLRSPKCKYVRNERCGNVPSSSSVASVNPMIRTHDDAMAMYKDVIEANSRLPSSSTVSYSLEHVDPTMTSFTDNITASQYPQYARFTDRLHTFNKWPSKKSQRKEDMAYAGLYYTGKYDKVRCYHCGLELLNWQPKDDPLLQHIKMFPECAHILKVIKEIISTQASRI